MTPKGRIKIVSVRGLADIKDGYLIVRLRRQMENSFLISYYHTKTMPASMDTRFWSVYCVYRVSDKVMLRCSYDFYEKLAYVARPLGGLL